MTLIRSLLSLLLGATVTLGFAPFDVWPVPMVAIAAVFLLVRTLPVRQSASTGFLFGAGMFGAGTSWIYVSIHEFGAASPLLAGFLTLAFVLAISALLIMPLFIIYSWLSQRRQKQPAWQQALMFAGLWVIFEWVRSWLLTGFPWLLTGYSLIDTPFAGLAPVTGVYGLSLLLVTTGCLLASIIIPKNRRPASLLSAIVLGLWGLAFLLNHQQWTNHTGQLEFSAIQGNIPQELKWNPDFIQNTVNIYTNLSADQWQNDLIIWPENAVPVFYNRAKGFMQQLENKGKKEAATLITGVPVDDNSGDRTRYYNSVVALGQGEGRYDKQKLVPFGEYVPMGNLLRGLIDFFNLPMSEFSQGKPDQTLLQVADITIAPYICYEVVYPDFAAQQALNSGLLITISNDTWFGNSIGPIQHFQMARMRALETGRYLIRATNDGISALIDDRGQVLKTIPRFEQGVLTGTAQVMTGSTPFMNFGSWPTLFICLLMIICGVVTPRRS
ncbi:apolipoprotein N-acyltransferase [Endozoicomonas sp. (ex Bugula neritina AB1)]|nr:apolipoprotein N-acyltransferase [Endozoicomonas sp. (ex Bugula neritina AB1)]